MPHINRFIFIVFSVFCFISFFEQLIVRSLLCRNANSRRGAVKMSSNIRKRIRSSSAKLESVRSDRKPQEYGLTATVVVGVNGHYYAIRRDETRKRRTDTKQYPRTHISQYLLLLQCIVIDSCFSQNIFLADSLYFHSI